MEQKTEASQAVDEPVLPHLPRAVGYRHTMDNTEGLKGNKPVAVFCVTKPNPFGIPGLDYSASFPVTTETLFTADQMKAYARAALKAQPAPTEAAQGESPFKFRPWSKEAAMVEGWAAAEKAREAAQPDRHALQAEGKHPAPCARHCEATAFGIEIRRLEAENAQLRAAQGEDSARLDAEQYRPIGIIVGDDKIHGWHLALDPGESWNGIGHHKRVYVRIDCARASAETGGVKP